MNVFGARQRSELVTGAAAVLAAMLLLAGPTAARGALVTAKTDEVPVNVGIGPGETRELRIECRKGWALIAVHPLTAESPTQLRSPVANNPDLHITGEVRTATGVTFTIENRGKVDAIDSDQYTVFGRIECLNLFAATRDGRLWSFELEGAVAETIALGSGERGDLELLCDRKGVPIGSTVDLTDLQFVAEEYQRGISYMPTGVGFTFGNPAAGQQALTPTVICLDRSASKSASRADRAAKRPRAKPKVYATTKEHEVEPHTSAEERSKLAAKCPKRTAATGYGWDANDADGVDVFLRDFDLRGRKAIVEATNFGADSQTVSVTAVCVAMKIRG